jgi:hypothetical protein
MQSAFHDLRLHSDPRAVVRHQQAEVLRDHRELQRDAPARRCELQRVPEQLVEQTLERHGVIQETRCVPTEQLERVLH